MLSRWTRRVSVSDIERHAEWRRDGSGLDDRTERASRSASTSNDASTDVGWRAQYDLQGGVSDARLELDLLVAYERLDEKCDEIFVRFDRGFFVHDLSPCPEGRITPR